MKFLADLFPVVLFFGAYWLTRNMFVATAVAIVATFVQVLWAWIRHRKVETMQWVSLGLIVVLGGATLLFGDKHFIMWKPTALYWLMAGGLLIGELAGKNGIRALLGREVTLPEPVWRKLNYAWVAFFAVMGGLNLFVAYHFSEDVWVNFKLFGGMGLMLVFVVGQALYLSRHMQSDDKP